jgi:hypothetical protein
MGSSPSSASCLTGSSRPESRAGWCRGPRCTNLGSVRRRILIPIVLAGLTVAVCASFRPAVAPQGIGARPPAVSAGHWFNWIGDGPTLESLDGRTVLVHFFVCKEPKKAAWLGLLKFHHDHVDKGLVILAVTRDSRGAVEDLLDDYPLPFPVGAASDMQSTWGANGDYGQVVLDTHGEVFYRTDASNGTWNGKLLKALKGSDRLGAKACLRLVPEGDHGKGVRRVLELMGAGKMAKAFAALDAIDASTSASEDDREEAIALRKALEDHVATLMEQIEQMFERREVLPAKDALEALEKELRKHPLGESVRARISSSSDDETYPVELEAAEEYERLVDSFWRRGWKKNLARFEKLVEKYPETRAAQKMKNFWIPHSW